jgi:hypothetical protein
VPVLELPNLIEEPSPTSGRRGIAVAKRARRTLGGRHAAFIKDDRSGQLRA